MPKLLRIEGLRVVICPNDHPPAHVHVIGPDWEVVINLVGLSFREIINGGVHHARRVLQIVAENRAVLLDARRAIHV
jgi:Domain of unknown function (DUF4160)